jgi:hypothetical protein
MPRTEKPLLSREQKAHPVIGRYTAERTRVPEQAEHAGAPAGEQRRPEGNNGLSEAFDADSKPVESATKGFSSLPHELMSTASEAFERSSQGIQSLVQARTVDELFQAQIDLMSCLMDVQRRYVEAIGRAVTQPGAASDDKAAGQQTGPSPSAQH